MQITGNVRRSGSIWPTLDEAVVAIAKATVKQPIPADAAAGTAAAVIRDVAPEQNSQVTFGE